MRNALANRVPEQTVITFFKVFITADYCCTITPGPVTGDWCDIQLNQVGKYLHQYIFNIWNRQNGGMSFYCIFSGY